MGPLSDETAAQLTGHEPYKRTQRFRRSADAIILDADQRRRQAAAMALGWRMLGSAEALKAFFNTHHEDLGGRPLDLAVDSSEGFARVECLLLQLGATGAGKRS